MICEVYKIIMLFVFRLFDKQKQYEDSLEKIAEHEEKIESLKNMISELKKNVKEKKQNIEGLVEWERQGVVTVNVKLTCYLSQKLI